MVSSRVPMLTGLRVPTLTDSGVAGPEMAGSEMAGSEMAGQEMAGQEMAGPEMAGPERPTQTLFKPNHC